MKVYYPNELDDITGGKGIANVYADKFDKLYDYVSCINVDVMNVVIKHVIGNAVGRKCICNWIHGNQTFHQI